MQTIAANVTAAGAEQDYTPNPMTMMKFPFAYGDTFTDTYQKAGSSPDTVRLIYDGYGTLMLPDRTTELNVVRIERRYSGGSDYVWYPTNSFFIPLLVYTYSDNMLTATGGTLVGVDQEVPVDASVTVGPVPATHHLNVSIDPASMSHSLRFVMVDARGAVVMDQILLSPNSTLELDRDIAGGGYYYQVRDDERVIASGKVSIGR